MQCARGEVTVDSEPFLLHQSSKAFLDGDPRGIRERFQFRYDALDYLAMAAIAAGFLVFLIDIARIAGWLAEDTAPDAVVAVFVVAALLVAVGFYFLDSRHRRAAAQERMIREGRVLAGTLIACAGRAETTAEASLGEVPRLFLVDVEYGFTSPTGQDITDHAEHSRPDLRRAELPEAGTPVRVLYLDDHAYALL